MNRNICSMPFTLTHQLRNSMLGTNRSQLRHYALASNPAFPWKSNMPSTTLRLEARANFKSPKASYRLVGATTLGLAGLSLLITQKRIHCDARKVPSFCCGRSQANHMVLTLAPSDPHPLTNIDGASLPPPPQSSVNAYELTFGTICGVCAGVFVKKGAKALAFVFGGIFVVLQVCICSSVTGTVKRVVIISNSTSALSISYV